MVSLDEFVELLYDLDRSELRAIAYEALLISDGPDKIPGNVDHSEFDVLPLGPGAFDVQTLAHEKPKGFVMIRKEPVMNWWENLTPAQNERLGALIDSRVRLLGEVYSRAYDRCTLYISDENKNYVLNGGD